MDYNKLNDFFSGYSLDSYQIFGAHQIVENEVLGFRFTLWAPNADKVELIGDFNNWNGYNHCLVKIDNRGIYSIFVEGDLNNCKYKYRIYNDDKILIKADPYAFFSELRPNTASIVYNLDGFNWEDSYYLNKRTKNFEKAVNIYELHLASWKKNDGKWLMFKELKDYLIPYCLTKGYTHIEFLPLLEHPFDGSWGYQTSGYFSATSRYGSPQDLMDFINQCHLANLGVILDMVLVHFVKNDYGLIEFDGSRLYEYLNEDVAFSEWGTMNFDLGKEEVRSFLMSSTAFWIDYFHFDGIRFDAVKNLIYWGGEIEGGENAVSLAFIKRLNYAITNKYPKVMLIAEDSSAYPKVTQSVIDGGLGFDYKWDLGWMNDTLRYYELDPIFRSYHHHDLTFSMDYFYSEHFLLPLSHDEVVHGKKSIINKMWGDDQAKFAQVKNLYLYQYCHPGKKLNFMGNEIGMEREWNEEEEIDWDLLSKAKNQKLERFCKDISHIYRYSKVLYCNEYSKETFKWIEKNNSQQQIFSFYREYQDKIFVIVLNMTPIFHEKKVIEVPYYGKYVELINSEWGIYGGSDLANKEVLFAKEDRNLESGYFLEIKLAPFAAIIFDYNKNKEDLDKMISLNEKIINKLEKNNNILKLEEKMY